MTHRHRTRQAAVTAQRPDWPSVVRSLELGGRSRAQIAREVGVARSTVTRIANGETRAVTFETGSALLLIRTSDD